MLSPIPRRNRGVHISLSSPTMAAFPDFWAGRLPHCVFRGLLSVHSRYGLHTCQVTYMTLYTGGFSRFVTSTTAPIATGWSDLAGRDSHPLRNRAFARRTKNRTQRECQTITMATDVSSSVGTPRPTFTRSTARLPAAHNQYSCCDQRDFLFASHRLSVASSSARVPSLGHHVPLFPHVEELRCMDLPATRNL